MHANTIRKYHKIQAEFRRRYKEDGKRREVILEELERKFFLSQDRIVHIICIDLEPELHKLEESYKP